MVIVYLPCARRQNIESGIFRKLAYSTNRISERQDASGRCVIQPCGKRISSRQTLGGLYVQMDQNRKDTVDITRNARGDRLYRACGKEVSRTVGIGTDSSSGMDLDQAINDVIIEHWHSQKASNFPIG